MSEAVPAKIVIAPNGPYLISGGVPLTLTSIEPNAEGVSWEWKAGDAALATGERYALCRCGASEKKPFCDGTHARNGFDGSETAARDPLLEAETLAGPGLTLEDAKALCAYARFCDVADSIWTDIARVDDPAVRELVVHEATHCPSGRLVLRDTATGEAIEPDFAPSIELVEDPAKACSGPLYVRGGIPLFSADGGAYSVRNRVALCRCGRSSNKPFCDGTHVDVAFVDGLGGDA